MINGLKLIYQTGSVDIPDDPSYPLRLDLNFRVPEFMTLAFIARYGGSEDVVVRAQTMEALVQFLAQNEFLSHPRIRWATVTGPDGLRENLELGSPPRCIRMDEMEVYSNGKQVKARTLDGRVQSMSDALIEKAAKALEMETGVKP